MDAGVVNAQVIPSSQIQIQIVSDEHGKLDEKIID
jgi:hypothetical protein